MGLCSYVTNHNCADCLESDSDFPLFNEFGDFNLSVDLLYDIYLACSATEYFPEEDGHSSALMDCKIMTRRILPIPNLQCSYGFVSVISRAMREHSSSRNAFVFIRRVQHEPV